MSVEAADAIAPGNAYISIKRLDTSQLPPSTTEDVNSLCGGRRLRSTADPVARRVLKIGHRIMREKASGDSEVASRQDPDTARVQISWSDGSKAEHLGELSEPTTFVGIWEDAPGDETVKAFREAVSNLSTKGILRRGLGTSSSLQQAPITETRTFDSREGSATHMLAEASWQCVSDAGISQDEITSLYEDTEVETVTVWSFRRSSSARTRRPM